MQNASAEWGFPSLNDIHLNTRFTILLCRIKGSAGTDASNGAKGLKGAVGFKGHKGFAGDNGSDGSNGVDGLKGIAGAKGFDELRLFKTRLNLHLCLKAQGHRWI